MNRRSVRGTPAVQSLDRGLSILEAVGQSAQPVPLKKLTALLGIDRSNAFRLANTLRRRRFLADADSTNAFVLGPSAWRLANQCGRSRLIAVCHDHVRGLAEAAGETAHLAVREGSQALLLDNAVAQGRVVMVSGLAGEYVAPVQHSPRQGAPRRLRSHGDPGDSRRRFPPADGTADARLAGSDRGRLREGPGGRHRDRRSGIPRRGALRGGADPRRRRTDRGVGGHLGPDDALSAEAFRDRQGPGRRGRSGDHEGAGRLTRRSRR